MIIIDSYKEQPVGVLGLGLTGLVTARALLAGGAKVISWDDDRATRRRALSQLPALRLLPPEAAAWRGVALFVPSPGISEKHALIRDLTLLKTKMAGDVELFSQALCAAHARAAARGAHARGEQAKVVAITGTNGKSTTTALTAHILESAGLKVQMGGNIGRPVLDLAPSERGIIYVLEISSYQADRVESLSPTIAVQLNLAPDHTSRHGSLEKYAAAKAKLFAHLNKNSVALINTSDKFGKKLYQSVSTKKIELNKSAYPAGISCGVHNKENVVAAYQIVRALGVSDAIFARGLASFKPLPHRQELIAEINGVLFVNDSKATNAHAVKPALARYQSIHWLAGGAVKGEGFEPLAKSMASVKHAYLFGAAADKLALFLQGKVSFSQYKTLEEATRSAIKNAKSGVVLLSPACASFDSFRDFTQRGFAFGSHVRDTQSPKIILAAGGTGGGLFPAVGVAHRLRAHGKAVYLFHDKRATAYLDQNQHKWDGQQKIISAPIAARSPLGLLAACFLMGLGVLQSIYFLLRVKGAKVIVGFGGYPSVPVLVAGALLRIPLVLHEPGGVLGRANKTLLPLAKKLSLSVSLEPRVGKSVVTGNPVREQISYWQGTPYVLPKRASKEPFRIFVFAGSQGAAWFDKNITQALYLVGKAYKGQLLVWQQSRGNEAHIKKLYDEVGIECELAPFFDKIESVIARSHLVIARAGASTISELSLLGRPAILIPHCGAAPGAEQKANAENFVQQGGGWMMEEGDFTPEKLSQKIEALLAQPKPLLAAVTAGKGRGQGKNIAADKLADVILEVANNA